MNYKILIVDDEVPIRRLLEKLFSSDYEVFCAEDASEALQIVEEEDISLIISDQRMPGMTGVEMFEKLVISHPQIMRILLSGYIEKSELQQAREKRLIHNFISKPWSLKELKSAVGDAIKVFERKNANEKVMIF